MKIGTDAVLIGCLALHDFSPRNILDVGAGCGLIALMLAQRFPDAQVAGIELHSGAAAEAAANAESSAFAQRISIHQGDFLDFQSDQKLDAIVSNPPYFKDALRAAEPGRSNARHQVTLSLHQLLQKAAGLIRPGGRISLILPPREMEVAEKEAQAGAFFLVKKHLIKSTADQAPIRIISEWSYQTGSIAPDVAEWVIYESNRSYTDQYKTLVRDFLMI